MMTMLMLFAGVVCFSALHAEESINVADIPESELVVLGVAQPKPSSPRPSPQQNPKRIQEAPREMELANTPEMMAGQQPRNENMRMASPKESRGTGSPVPATPRYE